MAAVRGRKIGFVFQSYNLIPTLTAEENVLLPYELTGGNGDGRERARQLLTPWDCSIARNIIQSNFRAANSSGSRWRGRLS